MSDNSERDGGTDLDEFRRQRAALSLAVVRARAAAMARDAQALAEAAYRAMQASDTEETTEYLLVAYEQAKQLEGGANALRVLVRADRDAWRGQSPRVMCPECGVRQDADVVRAGGSRWPVGLIVPTHSAPDAEDTVCSGSGTVNRPEGASR